MCDASSSGYKQLDAFSWYTGDEPLIRSVVKADGTFRNPWPSFENRNLLDVLRWKLLDCSTHAPKFPTPEEARTLLPSVEAVDWPTIRSPQDGLNATWCGHASFLVQHGGVNILTDPVWSDRASPVQFAGPKRMVPLPMRIDELPSIHIVTISHNHYDHLDTPTVKELILRHNHPIFVVPLRMKSKWFAKLPADARVDLSRVFELDWWERVSFTADQVFNTRRPSADDGDDIRASIVGVPVQHWSMRNGMDRFQELWCGFVIDIFSKPRPETGQSSSSFRRVFHAGDTGYCSAFEQIGRVLGPMDLSLIPIGAYSPRYFMKAQHVDPAEAVQIHVDVKSKTSLGMHWGTFILTDEPVDEPPKLLRKSLAARGIPPDAFRALKHGETIRLP